MLDHGNRVFDSRKLDALSVDSVQEDRYMTRKTRSDQTVGSFEKKQGLPPGTIRNPDGRDTRSDKKIGTIRKEAVKPPDKKK